MNITEPSLFPADTFDQKSDRLLRDPKMMALLKQHFLCDFGDIIPSMSWDDKTNLN